MSFDAIDEPPRICPSCGHDMSDHPYFQEGPGPAARTAQRVAVWLLPMMAAVWFLLLFLDVAGHPWGIGAGRGYLALPIIGGPSAISYVVSRLLPRTRRVICLHCSWNREYAAPQWSAKPSVAGIQRDPRDEIRRAC